MSLKVLLQKLPKKDLMLGLNKDEGTYSLPYGMPGYTNTGQSLITRDQFLKGVTISMPGAENVTKETVISQYTDWMDENDGMKNRDALGSLLGDRDFVCPLLEFAHR